MTRPTSLDRPRVNLQLPYHERFGTPPVRTDYFDSRLSYVTPPPVPEFLMTDDDYRLQDGDDLRMAGNAMLLDDPVVEYFGYPKVQRNILAEERAASRLRASSPHLYSSLVAAERIHTHIARTPLVDGSDLLDDARDVVMKLECQQRQRSFKVRGALNAMLSLDPARLEQGVISTSQGNHAQGVALAAQLIGTEATIFMSHNASQLKIDNTEALGATVILAGTNFGEATAAMEAMKRQRPELTEIHAYDNDATIAGQGTVGLEMLARDTSIASFYCGIGGGGLISGNAAVVKQYDPTKEVVGVQLEGSDSAYLSLQAGKRVTLDRANHLCDGTAVCSPAPRTFEMMQQYVDRVIVVTETELARAVVDLQERRGIVAEAAGALSLAGARKDTEYRQGRAGLIISGGNRTPDAYDHLRSLVR